MKFILAIAAVFAGTLSAQAATFTYTFTAEQTDVSADSAPSSLVDQLRDEQTISGKFSFSDTLSSQTGGVSRYEVTSFSLDGIVFGSAFLQPQVASFINESFVGSDIFALSALSFVSTTETLYDLMNFDLVDSTGTAFNDSSIQDLVLSDFDEAEVRFLSLFDSSSQGFLVEQLTYRVTSLTGPISAVPLPASSLLLMGGLVGLAGLRRRQTAKDRSA